MTAEEHSRCQIIPTPHSSPGLWDVAIKTLHSTLNNARGPGPHRQESGHSPQHGPQSLKDLRSTHHDAMVHIPILSLNSFPTSFRWRFLVYRVQRTVCVPTSSERALVVRILVYSFLVFFFFFFFFCIANSFTDLFGQKSVREVTRNFLPNVLNMCFAKFTWNFLLCWDW
jgi:hypothetical protein